MLRRAVSDPRSDSDLDAGSGFSSRRAPAVGVIVREEELHVADSTNPDLQVWNYEDETLDALIRHLEAIAAGSVRVAGPEDRLLPLLRQLVHLEIDVAVVGGLGRPDEDLAPRSLLPEEGGREEGGSADEEGPGRGLRVDPQPLDATLRARLRALDERLGELEAMCEREVARRDDRSHDLFAASLEEHVRWLGEREEVLRAQFIALLRASPSWRTVPSGSASD